MSCARRTATRSGPRCAGNRCACATWTCCGSTGRWEELVDLDPGDEQAHVELMRRYADGGDRHAGLRQFERLDRALRRELGVGTGRRGDARCAIASWRRPARAAAAPPTLIGRDDELATIERLLREAGDGRARTIIVTGPAGIGKSAVLREARALAERMGMAGRSRHVSAGRRNLAVRPGDRGARRRLPPPPDAARRSRRHVPRGDRSGPARRRRHLVGPNSDTSGCSSPRPNWSASPPRGHGLLLTVDDLHSADEASLRLLHYLARATLDERVAIIVTHRPQPMSATLADIRDSLIGRHGAVSIDLAPLDRDGDARPDRPAPRRP